MAELTFHQDVHRFCLLRPQALGGKHVFYFGRADTDGQGGKGTMRARVGISAYDSHTGQCGALLGADDMDNTLPPVVHFEFRDAQLLAILVERVNLQARYGIGDSVSAFSGRHVVIGHGQYGFQPPRFAARKFQSFECLRTGDFVHQMAININERHSIRLIGLFVHHVTLPKLIVQRLHVRIVFPRRT